MYVRQRTQRVKPDDKHSTVDEPQQDPIDILMKEHEECLKYLARLHNAAGYIKSNGFSFEAYSQIAETIRFIDTVVRQHDEKEEKYLFPVMDRHIVGPPQSLRSEHRELWFAFRQLLRTVEDIEEGRLHGTSIAELVQSAEAVVEVLTSHIAKENEVVYPMAKQIMTKEEYCQLKEQIEKLPLLVPEHPQPH